MPPDLLGISDIDRQTVATGLRLGPIEMLAEVGEATLMQGLNDSRPDLPKLPTQLPSRGDQPGILKAYRIAKFGMKPPEYRRSTMHNRFF